MKHPNPLRKAAHAIPVAALSFLLLFAGMCRPSDDASPSEAAGPPSVETGPSAAEIAEAAERERQAALAEAAEQERLAALAAAEQELAERQAALAAEEERLAAERERLRREREMRAEQERLATERAAVAAREREVAEREREMRERQTRVANAGELDREPAAPEPLPEPTGTYEGDFDEPWRVSQGDADGGEETASAPPGTPPAPAGQKAPAPAGRRVSVQAGELLEVQLAETLSSATAREGDRFSARLVEDLRNESGTLVVPAGAVVRGRIIEAVPYRRGAGPARLGVEFTEIIVSAEQTVGIRASFLELGADRRKNRKKVVAGAVVGAILGHILGGDGSGSVIVGAAAGAAAGGAMVASSKDRDAEIPGGQLITLQLEEVVTVEIQYGGAAGR